MSTLSNQPDDLPEALTAELRSLYSHDVVVPRRVDETILHEARAGFARRRRFRLFARVGAIAACLAVSAALVALLLRNDHPIQPAAPVAATVGEDVDRSGKVDILDAFVVAKLIEVREQIDKRYDVNADGKVDQSDVDRIAMVAVDTSRGAADAGRVQ